MRVCRFWKIVGLPGWWFVLCLVLAGARLTVPGEACGEDRLEVQEAAGAAGGAEQVRALPSGWSRVRTERLEIQYDPAHPGGLSQLTEQGDELLETAADQLGIEPGRPYVVRLAHDRAVFEAVQPGRPPAWASGTAYPRYGLMVLLTGGTLPWAGLRSLEKVFVHESVHLLLGEVSQGRPMPRWFDEGVARLVAREFSMEEMTLLSRGVLVGGLIWFSELDRGFPLGPGRANLAYAQSRAFLSYLMDRFGPEVLPELVREVGAGRTLNESLWQVVHHGLNALEEDWRAELKRDFRWLTALFGGATVWALMGLLVVLAYFKRKAQSRRRRAMWAEEEGLLADIPMDTVTWTVPLASGTDRPEGPSGAGSDQVDAHAPGVDADDSGRSAVADEENGVSDPTRPWRQRWLN